MLVPLFLLKIFVVTNPSSQFLQARNFKVEMLERGIPFDAGIVSPVPKTAERDKAFCVHQISGKAGVLHAADEHGGRSSWPLPIRPPAEDAPPSSAGGLCSLYRDELSLYNI